MQLERARDADRSRGGEERLYSVAGIAQGKAVSTLGVIAVFSVE